MKCRNGPAGGGLPGLAFRLAALLAFPACAVHGLANALPQEKARINVRVADETGAVVTGARIVAERQDTREIFRCETDFSGRCELNGLSPMTHTLLAQKEGFYAVRLTKVFPSTMSELEITLNHVQEYKEVVTVEESRPDIDLARTSSNRKLVYQDILNLPYKTTRDFRNVLPLMPGVLQDAQEQIHPGGAAAHQMYSQMDGFSIGHPATGLLETRVSVDALRSMQLDVSRYSAEYGKGSGGVLAVETGMGDDRFRFSATNFVPSLQLEDRIFLDKWTPRATFSGPLHKGKAWFFEAIDFDYNQDYFSELPAGANRTTSWRTNALTKVQLNWNPANILTAGLLLNRHHADHAGLSQINPVESTSQVLRNAWQTTLKNQTFITREVILELGFSASRSSEDRRPLGRLPYVLSPGKAAGSHFETAESDSRRIQWLTNLYLPSFHWNGRHQFKIGVDFDSISYRQLFSRRPISMMRPDGSLALQASFSDVPPFRQTNQQLSGFVQDRWSLSRQFLLELGMRFDRDSIVQRELVAPRMAATYLIHPEGETKISMGVGLFYDATRLDLVSRPLAGRRLDQLFSLDGSTTIGLPQEISFQVDPRELRAPRVLNWSISLEQKLPAAFFLRAEFLQKRGKNGLAFADSADPRTEGVAGTYSLHPLARDRYDAVELAIRRAFKSRYMFLASYTRSSARSNAVVDLSLSNPVFGRQAGGPQTWDAPNRFLSWGWIPIWKKLDLAYSLEWRSGFPFSRINQLQRIVGLPNSQRFPARFAFNLHVERRFQWLRYQWALRVGCNNLTSSQNPTVVDSNIDSPGYLTYSGLEHRAFTARIRLLGRK